MHKISLLTLSLSSLGLLSACSASSTIDDTSESVVPALPPEAEQSLQASEASVSPNNIAANSLEITWQLPEFSTSQPANSAPTAPSASLPTIEPPPPFQINQQTIRPPQLNRSKLNNVLNRSLQGSLSSTRTNASPVRPASVATPSQSAATNNTATNNAATRNKNAPPSVNPSTERSPEQSPVVVPTEPVASPTPPTHSTPTTAPQARAVTPQAAIAHPESSSPESSPSGTLVATTSLSSSVAGNTNRQQAQPPSTVTRSVASNSSTTQTVPIAQQRSASNTTTDQTIPTAQQRSASNPRIAQSPQATTPATPATPAALPASIVGIGETYILGPGDVIQINVLNVPEYSGQQQILADGSVNLPLVGNFSVAGKTLKQAGDAIAALYVAELQNSVVSVSLVQQRPLQIAVIGEITQPGLYTLAANQNAQFPTVIQAIQQAGGVTQAANLRQIEVRRREQNGNIRTTTIDLQALLQVGDLSQNSFLRDGDVVFIPATAEINLADASQLAVSNLRSSTDQPLDVAVVGEVARPGPYRLAIDGQPTLIQSLQLAGGITPSADLRQVELRRKTRQGADQVIKINLWEILQTGDLSQDVVLQQGDRISVPAASELTATETASLTGSSLSTGSININIMGEVESPGQITLQANTTLSQAILAAGGFNGRANSEVKLIRFNPNGTVTQQEIDLDLTEELNPETNPVLRNNDVVVVGRSTGAAITDALSDGLNLFNLFNSILNPIQLLF